MVFIADLFKVSQEQAVDYVAELHKAAPQFQQVELEWLGQLQHGVAKLKEYALVTKPDLKRDDFNLPVFALFLFPLLYWPLGKPYCYKILFAMSVTSLLCFVAQLGSRYQDHMFTNLH